MYKLHIRSASILNLDQIYINLIKSSLSQAKAIFAVEKERLETASKYFENICVLNHTRLNI